MRRRSSFVVGMVLACAIARTERAHAQEGDLARARALYDEAGELERRGQWPQAVDKLRAALRIRETPNLRYALGWALENDDKLLEARAEYDVAERTARGSAEDVAQLARARRAELDAKTPVVRVNVPAAWRTTAHVTVDGRDAAVQGGTSVLPVNPGARVVRVEGAGGAPVERIVYVSRGETKTVDVPAPEREGGAGETRVATAARFPERSTSAHADDASHGERVLPWVLVGGGAALAATGAVLFVSSLGDASRRDDAMHAWCTQTSCTGGNTATVPETPQAAAQRQEAEDAASRGNMKQTAAAILGGAGVVAAAVGGVLLVRGSESKEPARSARGLRVIAVPTLGGAAASATLRF